MLMRKKRIIYTLAVTLIVVFSTTFAILMTLERRDYRNYLQGEYSKNMYELINSVENIRANLSKVVVSGSREQSNMILQEVFRHSAIANEKLHSLPIAQEQISGSSKFLSQVGDFCYILAKASADGVELSDNDYNTIDRLKEEAFTLEKELNIVLLDINEGKVKWGEIRKKASGVFAKTDENSISNKFAGIQKQLTQYPVLVYDGPFSDTVLEIKPRIEQEKEISQKQAEEEVKKVIGKEKIDKIELHTENGKGRISSYSFSVTVKNRGEKQDKVNCEISKNGGKVIYLLDNREIGNASIDGKKASEIGAKYLEGLGYKNMVPSYTLTYGKAVLINYIYSSNNIMIYPEQIKLKIALDDGSVIGIESEKYLVAHIENRKIETPRVSQEEARAKVGKKLQISATRLAVVPTETNKEILCYEFIGSYKGDSFIVYINASNGKEQKIVQIINTPNGQLSI